MESARHIICGENQHLINTNGKLKELPQNKLETILSSQNSTEDTDTSEDNTGGNSTDDDDTLSNKTEPGDDEINVACEKTINLPVENIEEESSFSEDSNEFAIRIPGRIPPHCHDKTNNVPEGSPPVFYLEPGDWEPPKSNLTMPRNCSSPSLLYSTTQGDSKYSSGNHRYVSKPNNCQRIPSPLSLSPPCSSISGLRKPIIQQSRRLLSPQTLYNPLLSRLHQSESMQTLPECGNFNCSDTKTGERVRSYSSSSNQRSCHNLYRQSFGSGSYSGPLSPLSTSGSIFFTSPVKRGSIVNDSMAIPTNNKANGHNLIRRQVFSVPTVSNNNSGVMINRNSMNYVRQRKTAIPLLCSRAVVMVRTIHKQTHTHIKRMIRK